MWPKETTELKTRNLIYSKQTEMTGAVLDCTKNLKSATNECKFEHRKEIWQQNACQNFTIHSQK